MVNFKFYSIFKGGYSLNFEFIYGFRSGLFAHGLVREHCIYSELFNPWRGVRLVWRFRQGQLQRHLGSNPGFVLLSYLPCSWVVRDGHLQGPLEVRSNWASSSMLTGQTTSCKGSRLDSSTHEQVNPGGAGGHLLHTRTNSSEWAASSGSEVGNLSGAGRLIGSFILDSGDKAPSVVTGGATGSLFAMSSISSSNRFPFSTRGMRHLWSSCTALHSTPGGIPDLMSYLWRAMAITTVPSLCTTQMSQTPWNSFGGR